MKAPTHCRECGEHLAQELREIGSPVHVLCGTDAEAKRISYCLWGREDGHFTPFHEPRPVVDQPSLFS